MKLTNTFTKNQAGVIYKAWKENKIELTKEEINSIYKTADICSNFYSNYYSQNNTTVDCLNYIVESIFAGNYEDAQWKINFMRDCKISF